MKFDKHDKVVKAPDGLNNSLYKLTKAFVKAAKIKNSLIGTKEEVLAKAAKMNAKSRHFIMPTDNKAHYTDHLIQGQYHCLEINIEKKRRDKAILFVFGGGMILGSDKGDVGLSRKIAETTNSDVWFPYYPLCHEHDMLENVQMIYECYTKMLTFYKPENIVFVEHADCEKDALYIKDALKDKIKAQIHVCSLGPIISATTGPDTITVNFYGEEVTLAGEE